MATSARFGMICLLTLLSAIYLVLLVSTFPGQSPTAAEASIQDDIESSDDDSTCMTYRAIDFFNQFERSAPAPGQDEFQFAEDDFAVYCLVPAETSIKDDWKSASKKFNSCLMEHEDVYHNCIAKLVPAYGLCDSLFVENHYKHDCCSRVLAHDCQIMGLKKHCSQIRYFPIFIRHIIDLATQDKCPEYATMEQCTSSLV